MSLSGARCRVTRVAETASSWDGAPLPAYPAGRPQVTILRATIPPHATLPRHTHAVVNAGVILRGELTVVSDNGTERTFRAGEGIVELVGTDPLRRKPRRRGDRDGDVLRRNGGRAALRECGSITESYDDETNYADHSPFCAVADSCGYRREFLHARLLAAPRRDDAGENATAYEYMYAEYPFLRPWTDSLERAGALRDTVIVDPQGVRLHALYAAAPEPTDRTAVIVHGYTDCAVRMLMIGYLYNHDLRYNVLLPDLHYHGRSEGRAIRMGWLDRLDVLRWMEVADTLFGGNTQMVVHGISMGAATTMMLAASRSAPM